MHEIEFFECQWVHEFWACQLLIGLFPSGDTNKIYSHFFAVMNLLLLDKVNH